MNIRCFFAVAPQPGICHPLSSRLSRVRPLPTQLNYGEFREAIFRFASNMVRLSRPYRLVQSIRWQHVGAASRTVRRRGEDKDPVQTAKRRLERVSLRLLWLDSTTGPGTTMQSL